MLKKDIVSLKDLFPHLLNTEWKNLTGSPFEALRFVFKMSWPSYEVVFWAFISELIQEWMGTVTAPCVSAVWKSLNTDTNLLLRETFSPGSTWLQEAESVSLCAHGLHALAAAAPCLAGMSLRADVCFWLEQCSVCAAPLGEAVSAERHFHLTLAGRKGVTSLLHEGQSQFFCAVDCADRLTVRLSALLQRHPAGMCFKRSSAVMFLGKFNALINLIIQFRNLTASAGAAWAALSSLLLDEGQDFTSVWSRRTVFMSISRLWASTVNAFTLQVLVSKTVYCMTLFFVSSE